jgi:hypothetical protein
MRKNEEVRAREGEEEKLSVLPCKKEKALYFKCRVDSFVFICRNH